MRFCEISGKFTDMGSFINFSQFVYFMKKILACILLILLLGCKPIQEPQQPVVQTEPTQEPQQADERQQLTTTITPARDLTGNWEGSIIFTNNCPNPACRYQGRMMPPSLTMNLVQNGNQVAGTVTVNFANFEIEELISGQSCGTFEELIRQGTVSQSQINDGVISSSRFTFTDVGDNNWDLSLTTDLLQGTITSKVPGCMGIKSTDVRLSRR